MIFQGSYLVLPMNSLYNFMVWNNSERNLIQTDYKRFHTRHYFSILHPMFHVLTMVYFGINVLGINQCRKLSTCFLMRNDFELTKDLI